MTEATDNRVPYETAIQYGDARANYEMSKAAAVLSSLAGLALLANAFRDGSFEQIDIAWTISSALMAGGPTAAMFSRHAELIQATQDLSKHTNQDG
jgi:hypothetical protein